MAIAETDLEYRYTNPAASAGNQLTQAEPAASLGGYMSRSVWTGGVLHDLFAAVTGDENAALVSEYRCLYLINKHATLTWTAPVLWLTAQTAGGANYAIGVDAIVARPLATSQLQATIVPDVNTPPANVAFSAPVTKETGLAVGSIPPGHGRAVWFRRTTANSAAAAADGASVRAEGDTLA